MAGERVPLTFFLAGFSKCGTTSLVELLDRHPQLAFPTEREPWFFGDPDYRSHWSSLRVQFPADLSPYLALGDDSTAYSSSTWSSAVLPRLAREYPEARYLFVVRDPVARIESAFREFHHSGPRYGMNTSFLLSDAMTEIPEVLADSCYAERLSEVRAAAPGAPIHVVFLEDLLDDPQSVTRGIYRFLGLDPHRDPVAAPLPALNRGERKRHDTMLLRRMRGDHAVGRTLARLSYESQERLLAALLLRREFSAAVEWDPRAIELVRRRVVPDAESFRAEYGVPRRGWRRLESVAGRGDPQSSTTGRT